MTDTEHAPAEATSGDRDVIPGVVLMKPGVGKTGCSWIIPMCPKLSFCIKEHRVFHSL